MSTTHDYTRTRHFRLIVVCLAATLVGGSTIAFTVYPRQIAATWGENPNDPTPVWETAVATDGATAIAVYHRGKAEQSPKKKIAYSVGSYDPNNPSQPWTWEEKGLIIADEYDVTFDPSIVYDPTSEEFVCVAAGYYTPDEEKQIIVSFYDPNEAVPEFGAWTPVARRLDDLQDPNDNALVDKPWLVAGENTIWGRELYIVWFDAPAGEQAGYAYARSVDGGQTWSWDEIKVDSNRITGIFCAQPACRQRVHEPNEPTYDPDDPNNPFEGDPLYIAYRHDNNTIGFLAGMDDNSDPNNPGLTFSYLTGATQIEHQAPLDGELPLDDQQVIPVPLRIQTNAAGMDLSYHVPGMFDVKTTPWLVVDPTDANRLFAVYQDVIDDQDPNIDYDVDVFVQKITRDGDDWVAHARVRVNQNYEDPNDPNSSDQFTPTVIIDNDGNLHVIYYDDRRWPEQNDGPPHTGDKFDVYYAISTDHGATWEERLLYAVDPEDPNEVPSLDPSYDDYGAPYGKFGPFEYPGLAYYVDHTREFLLASFTGTDPNDPYGVGNCAAIFSSLIVLDPGDPNNP